MDKLIENLRAVIGNDAVLSEPDELLVYECDGLPHHKHLPRAVVFPSSTEETAEVMQVLAQHQTPFTPRGAGTGLSGGALALNRGVVIELARMRRILEIDADNRTIRVQTGMVNLQVSHAVAHLGLHYVPDPSSQPSCTIGGNIAENAGGVHCLKYGTTTDHILSARVVLAGGYLVDLERGPGYDLLGIFVGSEGTFGIATEATLNLVPIPPAVRTVLAEFPDVNDASQAVSAIIAAGVMPAGLEMMDGEIIRAVEASIFAAGLSIDIGAALLIELDGIEAGIDDEAQRVKDICLSYRARTCRLARDENERKKLWAARKGAFGAIGRIAPDSMIQDAVVPRSRLPEVLADAYRISAKYQLRLANVFHAGDGNLHPLICFDSRSADDVRRVKEAGRELMETCVRAGGSITGEHGVGLDKRELLPLIFSDNDMDAMLRVRAAFDPSGLCNPGKIIPILRGCGEARAVSGLKDEMSGGRGDGETRGQGDKETRRPSDTETWGSDDTESRGHGDAGTRRGHFDADDIAKQLVAIVGDANISASSRPPVSASPSLPVSVSPLLPFTSLSVAPGSIEELCEIMKLAHHQGWKVAPAGAGTWLDVGNRLSGVDLVVSTTRLNQIIEHEPADLIATARAGTTLSNFNQTLAQRGQFVPTDPPDEGRSTLGGIVATGLGGAQRVGYGTPRNFVIGMKVALADGTSIKAGGRVVKNVAGYDLCKLFTGSYGTLGIITELTFKLRPVPEKQVTVLAEGSMNDMLAAGRSIRDAGLFPVGLELLSPHLAKLLDVEISSGNVLLLMRFAGIEKTVAHQADTAVKLLRRDSRIDDIEVDSDDRELWQQLAAVPISHHYDFSWRCHVQPARLGEFINAVQREYGDLSSSPWQAGVADGRLRVLSQVTDQTSQIVKTLRAAAESMNGSLIIENAPLDIKKEIDSWGSLGSAAALMKRVKKQFDPENLLSPGRFAF
ncbi:MAG TPA: FAD-linked oxidase C-terminal domain-containing protein [Pyrinomonadaceae bacterium]|nr:FAD-linked oxidase C-terminal domain-containing protein [Pyrinomonadaceae bacterium]